MFRILLTIMLAATIWALQAQSQSPLFSPAPGSPFRAGSGSYHLTLGNVNKDGKLDIAAQL